MTSRTPALNATAVLIRTGATLLRTIDVRVVNPSAPVLYLQIFNNAAPTVGTTAPNAVVEIPAGLPNRERPFKIEIQDPRGGKEYSTALSIACTTTYNGNTNPTAGQEPDVTIDYNAIGA